MSFISVLACPKKVKRITLLQTYEYRLVFDSSVIVEEFPPVNSIPFQIAPVLTEDPYCVKFFPTIGKPLAKAASSLSCLSAKLAG